MIGKDEPGRCVEESETGELEPSFRCGQYACLHGHSRDRRGVETMHLS